MYRENDNPNYEAINRYRAMSQEERDELLKKAEEEMELQNQTNKD